MGWADPPLAGEAYTRGRETRTVYDRSLCGDVLYYTGTQRKRHHRVTEVQWVDWVEKAALLDNVTDSQFEERIGRAIEDAYWRGVERGRQTLEEQLGA